MSVESWKLICEIGGLIVLGLTFILGGGAWFTSNILNKRQDVQLRNFDKKLTEAKTELGKQQERAAKAEKELREVGGVAALANEEAARANLRASELENVNLALRSQVATLELKAAEQQERAAGAEESLLRLQRSVVGRRLSPSQFDALVARLAASPFRNDASLRIHVTCFAADPEGRALANQIMSAVEAAGWNGTGVGAIDGVTTIPPGIRMLVTDDNRARSVARSFEDTFSLAGMEYSTSTAKSEGSGIEIIVGRDTKSDPTT